MRRRLALGAALAAGSLAVSAGHAAAGNIYLPDYGTTPEAISGFARAQDGSLTPLPGSPFPLPSTPTGVFGLAFTPDGTRGVAAYLFDGGVRGLTVAPDGSIATAGPAILTPSVQGVTISPNGRFAYVPTRDFNWWRPSDHRLLDRGERYADHPRLVALQLGPDRGPGDDP